MTDYPEPPRNPHLQAMVDEMADLLKDAAEKFEATHGTAPSVLLICVVDDESEAFATGNAADLFEAMSTVAEDWFESGELQIDDSDDSADTPPKRLLS